MTGTALQNRLEIRRVYKIWVVCVPTNKPILRELWPDKVYPNEDAKFDAIVDEIQKLKTEGRSVLIGTRSVDKSEILSQKLHDAGLIHQVLNAKNHELEAKIIEQAGQLGRITIATNMAGRGTDIKPCKEVIAAGGLHVLGTERHESIRIDRQLAGRAGRQGDPGSAQFFLSLDDELLEGLGQGRQMKLKIWESRGLFVNGTDIYRCLSWRNIGWKEDIIYRESICWCMKSKGRKYSRIWVQTPMWIK